MVSLSNHKPQPTGQHEARKTNGFSEQGGHVGFGDDRCLVLTSVVWSSRPALRRAQGERNGVCRVAYRHEGYSSGPTRNRPIESRSPL